MSKEKCKGGCGALANYKGWCGTSWRSGKRFMINCPNIEKKRGRNISQYRTAEAKLGKNPMQNSEICKKNHSKSRNKKAAKTLKKLGKMGLLPQQVESKELKKIRRTNISKTLKNLFLIGLHPIQTQNEKEKRLRYKRIAKSIKKLASEGKLFVQNMNKQQKKDFSNKISKTLRQKIKNGDIVLSRGWKRVPYRGLNLRSNWEKETAKFLDKNKLKWAYEQYVIPYFDTERRIIANTIPDFYLPDYNTFIEVKSNAEFKSIKTKDKMIGIRNHGHNVLLFGKREIKLIKQNKKRELIEMIIHERS